MADLEFTPIVPTLAGVAFTMTACDAGAGDTYTYVPISSNMRTVLVIQNTDQGGDHTVTFTSQPDEWGNEPSAATSDLNKIITVKAGTTVIIGTLLRSRWSDPTTDDYTCNILYDGTGWPGDEPQLKSSKGGLKVTASGNFNIAVVNVPNVSKD